MAAPASRRNGPDGLTPDVLRLGIVSLLNDISGEIIAPLIPIFLTSVLGAPVAVAGFVEGCAEAAASLLKGLGGRVSDLTGKRRRWVAIGYGISALARPVLGLATMWPMVLAARVADRLGKGLRTSPRDALLAESAPEEHRGKAFGWHRSLDSIGGVIGPLLALGMLAVFHQDIRMVFFLASIPALAAVALLAKVRSGSFTPATPERLSLRRLPAALRLYLLVWAFIAAANTSEVFFILRAKDMSGTVWMPVLFYSVYQGGFAIFSPRLGGLSDSLGRKRVLMLGLCVLCATYLGFIFAPGVWMLWLLFALHGVYMAATDGISRAYAVDLAPPELRASAIGMLGLVQGLAALAAGGIGGLLWTHVAPWATFAYGAAGAAIGALLLRSVPKTGK